MKVLFHFLILPFNTSLSYFNRESPYNHCSRLKIVYNDPSCYLDVDSRYETSISGGMLKLSFIQITFETLRFNYIFCILFFTANCIYSSYKNHYTGSTWELPSSYSVLLYCLIFFIHSYIFCYLCRSITITNIINTTKASSSNYPGIIQLSYSALFIFTLI